MIKKLLLLALTFGAFMMSSCNQVTLAESPIEDEKGHFKVVFTNTSAGTKGFWEQDAAKRSEGELCERTLNSVSIFVYKNTEDKCIYRRNFTSHEVTKKTAVFSLPEATYEHNKSYDFYAVANFNYGAATDLPSRAVLLAVTQADLGAYMGMTDAVGSATDSVGLFTAIYGQPSDDALALRTGDKGAGFVMSSKMVTAQVPADENTPRKVELPIARLVNKIEVKACTTDVFKTNYTEKYGSKLTIDTIKIANMPTASNLFASNVSIAATANDYKTICQIPGTQTVSGVVHYNSVIYGFENNFDAANAPVKRPELRICATYDFDGVPTTTDDITHIVYKKELTLSGTGNALRNTFYQVEVKINGLTAQEIITTVTVVPWDAVAKEPIDFGK